MQKPRVSYKKVNFLAVYKDFINNKNSKGQSLVEYLVLFAIVVGLSWVLVQGIPAIFSGYVSTATGAMQ